MASGSTERRPSWTIAKGVAIVSVAISAAACHQFDGSSVASVTNHAGTNGTSVRLDKANHGSLTGNGKRLWNLEALLRATFGTETPASADDTDTGPGVPAAPPIRSQGEYINFDCAGNECSPLSSYSPFFYTFSGSGASSFHLSDQNYRDWNFGNYPIPVLIDGKIVACDRADTTFLVEISDAASFTLDCLAVQNNEG